MKHPGAAWGASLGALIGYLLASATRLLPEAVYFPRHGTWGLSDITGEPAIHWYGALLWLVFGGAIGALAGRAVRERPPWWVAWGLGTVALLGLAIEQRHWFTR